MNSDTEQAQIVETLLAELRQERLKGRNQPDLIETGRAALISRLNASGMPRPARGALLDAVQGEVLARLPAANRCGDPELESFLIQTLAEVIDRARPHWSERF